MANLLRTFIIAAIAVTMSVVVQQATAQVAERAMPLEQFPLDKSVDEIRPAQVHDCMPFSIYLTARGIGLRCNLDCPGSCDPALIVFPSAEFGPLLNSFATFLHMQEDQRAYFKNPWAIVDVKFRTADAAAITVCSLALSDDKKSHVQCYSGESLKIGFQNYYEEPSTP